MCALQAVALADVTWLWCAFTFLVYLSLSTPNVGLELMTPRSSVAGSLHWASRAPLTRFHFEKSSNTVEHDVRSSQDLGCLSLTRGVMNNWAKGPPSCLWTRAWPGGSCHREFTADRCYLSKHLGQKVTNKLEFKGNAVRWEYLCRIFETFLDYFLRHFRCAANQKERTEFLHTLAPANYQQPPSQWHIGCIPPWFWFNYIVFPS